MSFHTILPEVHELMPPMVALRQHLHAHPELSEEEFDTSRLVADKLRDWGCDHHGLAGTGVVASLRKGQSQRIVGLRADMDALPIVETSGLPYASRHSGKMHACGHDGHTAMLLAAGQCLAQSIDFDGTVRLIFQPAEEGFPGRREWSKTACFNASPAMRYSPCTIGPIAGRLLRLPAVSLHGLGRYGNDPHQRPGWPRCHAPRNGRSGRRRGLWSWHCKPSSHRNLPPLDTGVVGIGSIHGGSSSTVVPTCVELAITVRALKETTRHLLLQRIEARACLPQPLAQRPKSLSMPMLIRCSITILKKPIWPRSVALSWLGEDGVLPDMQPMTCSEDFSSCCRPAPQLSDHGQWPGTEGGCPLHNPAYDFNDAALPYGASYWVRLVSTFLKPAG